QKPPAALPVYTVTARDMIDGRPYAFVAYYVSNGTHAWVGLPVQVIGPGASVPKEKWFIAPLRTTPAFLGKLAPLTAEPSTTTTTAPGAHHHEGSGGASRWIFAVSVIVVGIILIAV